MPLQFILGSSGSGKSHKMYCEMIEKSLEEPENTFVAIVPEQFTMQVQKDMVCMHPDRGMFNIDVLSFARLAYRVFEEIGLETPEVLDDTGKSLILRKVIEDNKGELVIFRDKIKMSGFIDEMKSMISEFFQYGIHEEHVEQLIEISKDKPILHKKMEDMRLLYLAFKRYLSDRYITTEEILDSLCKHIGVSGMIKNSEFYIDGFTGFTPIQYKVIGLLMKYSKKVTVTVTIGLRREGIKEIKEHHLFYLSRKTIDRLAGMAQEQNIPILGDVFLAGEPPRRFKENPSLAFLEKNIFRYRKNKGYTGKTALSIYTARNPYHEAEFVAAEIFTLIRERGYHYRDVAVITGDIERYYRALKEVFDLNAIPHFIDDKRSLTTNPLIEALRAVLEVIESRFSYESVFRYLRSGMGGIENEKIDTMENYVLARGIKGINAWKKEWEDENAGKIKEEFIFPLLTLYEELKNKEHTVERHTAALYRFITAQDMFIRLEQYRQNFLQQDQLDLVKEYTQAYKLVMDLLDKVVLLLGNEKLTFSEYKTVLETGFEEIKVGIIPPAIDQVVVGDIERTRLNHVKVLFFVGVNDGIIPKTGLKNGLLSEGEREFLKEKHIELSPTARENSFIQRFYLYLNLTKPNQHLILSFSKSSSDGTSLRPSYLISAIQKMFPGLPVIDGESEGDIVRRIISEYSGLQYLAGEIRGVGKTEMSRVAKDLYSLYYQDPGLKKKLNPLIHAAFLKAENGVLDKAVAKALYGGVQTNSVSRLEKFASCAYHYFLNYGLALTERKEYSIEAVDLGNLYHGAIELFSKRLEEGGFDYRTMPDDLRRELVHLCVEEVTRDYGNTVLLSSARNAYIIKRLERVVGRTVWALAEQIRRGKFSPKYYELSIQNGRIDRVDVYDEDENVYIRIIDYKSGNKIFDISDVYDDLQMQLLLYMNEVLEGEKLKDPEKNVIPAAVCYYHIKDPIINKGEELLEQFQMSGLINSSEEVIEAMDSGLEGKSIVVPISRKGGKLYKHANLVAQEDFQLLMKHVQKSAAKLNSRIAGGDIGINPYKKKNQTSCDYCPYISVCGFDPKIPSYRYRKIGQLKPEDVWKKIKEEKD